MLQSCYKCDDVVSHYKGKLNKAKSEAMSEFAERLKLNFDKAINGIPRTSKAFSLRRDILHDTHLIIDHVKKEMAGDGDA